MVSKSFFGRIQCVLLFFVAAFSLTACVPPGSLEYLNGQRLGMEEAVSVLGRNLKIQLGEAFRKEEGTPTSAQLIVMDPILSIESGQQFKANQQIESILTRELAPVFKVVEISPENLGKAGYVLAGALSQSVNLSNDSRSDCQLEIAILELSSGIVKAKSRIGISGFPSEPLSFYKDSPIFLRGKSVRLATLLFSWSKGQVASPQYLQFLPDKANIQEGILAYDQGRFKNAASSFEKAVKQSNGRTLSSYAGLYLSSQKLHQYRTAYRAFNNLLTTAIDENHRVDLRLQFRANSPAFIPDPELARQYAGWLKHIAGYTRSHRLCLDISGHSSRSGDQKNDEQLSLSRAKTIQGVMSITYPGIFKRSHVAGKGFRENIVGNGANDASDAVDRRIELSVITCSEL